MSNSSEIGKDNHHNCSVHSEDEEESLSLCDLPLVSTASDQEGEEDGRQREIGGEDQSEAKTAKASTKSKNGVSEDFDFGSLAASLDALESEMCAAEEVFFGGQILPFRHSVSSATASNLTRTVSRSESMDRNAGSGFRSSSTASSSRSSSTRSSSINSSASAGKLPSINHSTNSSHKRPPLKIRNQFHSFPSPKPYARAANAPRSSISSSTSSANKRSSALWEIFRLGLVRTPEIELEDLKIRYSKQHNFGGGGRSDVVISRNSSSGGSSSAAAADNGKSVNNRSCEGEVRSVRNKKERRKQRRRNGGAMNFMSCKCSAEAVEPEKAGKGMVVVNKRERKEEETETVTVTVTEEKQRKHDVSRHHRTFEWLRELSQAVVLNDVSS